MKPTNLFEAVFGFSFAIIFGLTGATALIVSILSIFSHMRAIMYLTGFRYDLLVLGLLASFMSYLLFEDLLKDK